MSRGSARRARAWRGLFHTSWHMWPRAVAMPHPSGVFLAFARRTSTTLTHGSRMLQPSMRGDWPAKSPVTTRLVSTWPRRSRQGPSTSSIRLPLESHPRLRPRAARPLRPGHQRSRWRSAPRPGRRHRRHHGPADRAPAGRIRVRVPHPTCARDHRHVGDSPGGPVRPRCPGEPGRAPSVFFRAPLHYDALSNQLVFARSDTTRPLVSADHALAGVVRRRLDKMLTQIPLEDEPIAARVRRMLLDSLARGESSADAVARELGVSKRTLHRRLRAKERARASAASSMTSAAKWRQLCCEEPA